VLQVINERSARTRALVGVTTERDIRKWSGSDEVRDLLDINNKMYVSPYLGPYLGSYLGPYLGSYLGPYLGPYLATCSTSTTRCTCLPR